MKKSKQIKKLEEENASLYRDLRTLVEGEATYVEISEIMAKYKMMFEHIDWVWCGKCIEEANSHVTILEYNKRIQDEQEEEN